MTPAEWIAATRPRTLGAAVVPVATGLALAGRSGPLDLAVAAVTLLAAVLIQVTTNFANDYFDALHGADGPDRLGPPRVSHRGPDAARAMKRATVIVAGLAAVAGLYLVVRGGVPILAIGVASLLAALAYTGGPYPLAYHGLGDLFVLVFFGPVAVLGTLLLQRAPVGGHAALLSLAIGCLATAILVVNNVRDVASDARVGKRTLAVRLGAGVMRWAYGALVVVAFAVCAIVGPRLTLLAAPLAMIEVMRMIRRSGTALNASLAGTARLHALFGILLVVGVLV